MPFTFFAHQAPVLPIARRWPHRVDGVTVVIGSMAPDMAYALSGSRFDMWAHSFPSLALFCVPVTLVVSWIIVRVLAPVVPAHLPSLGPFHLHDYSGLGTHRFHRIASPLWAMLGALSHVGLDSFTHGWGWFAHHVSWYDDVLIDSLFGRQWTIFRVVQYAGHIVGSVVCVWLLARYGRARWMRERSARAPTVTRARASSIVLATTTAVTTGLGVAWVALDSGGEGPDVLRIAAAMFTGLTLASLVILRHGYDV